jgi:hypothetical protein
MGVNNFFRQNALKCGIFDVTLLDKTDTMEKNKIEYRPVMEGYSIGTNGVVVNTATGRVLAQYRNLRGASLCIIKGVGFGVARLVACTYLGERDKGYVVRHKNGELGDNRVENMEWVERSAYVLDRIKDDNWGRWDKMVIGDRCEKESKAARQIKVWEFGVYRGVYDGIEGVCSKFGIGKRQMWEYKRGIVRKGMKRFKFESVVSGVFK